MAKADVKIHIRGVEQAFRESGVVEKLEEMAERIADSANEKTNALYPDNGYQKDHFEAKRYKTSHGNTGFIVGSQTKLARAAQAHHNVLTQAMDAGRG